jgi:LysR family glycine cleavage system transcriptional activator
LPANAGFWPNGQATLSGWSLPLPPFPPLPLIRTFEAAARRESFRRAAEELNVTPAAVSQQMRQLEGLLGVSLFVRRPRGLALNEAGRGYLAEVAPALARLAEATRRLARPGQAGTLRIAMPRSFATHWLLPRLPAFRHRSPGIELGIVADDRPSDLVADGIGVALRFGPGRYGGLDAELLMGDAVLPACAPALLGGRPAPRRLADLREFPLLHDDGLGASERRSAWPSWLAEDSAGPAAVPGQRLPDAGMVLEAAILGQGVGLVRRSLAERHLASGRLVRLLAQERQTDFAYWILTPAGAAADARAAAFRDWIRAETAAARGERDGA